MPSVLISKVTLWCILYTQTEYAPEVPTKMDYFDQRLKNLKIQDFFQVLLLRQNNVSSSGCFFQYSDNLFF